MEFGGLQCHGCGSSNVTFDPKRRVLKCNQCGKEEYYSRATLNANGKVHLSKDNAINFFIEGKFENAKHYALEILNIVMDNAPALYIIAYYDEFIMYKSGSLKQMFISCDKLSLEYDEVRDIIKLFIASARNLENYETDIIELLAKNMQADEDKEELCNTIDKLCPYFINKRPSMDYFTQEQVEMYHDLAEHCSIPKTCFALLKSMNTNPDSPYVNENFFLRAKSKYFYDNYVLPLGNIIEAISDPELKKKFIAAYKTKKEQYEKDSGIN